MIKLVFIYGAEVLYNSVVRLTVEDTMESEKRSVNE